MNFNFDQKQAEITRSELARTYQQANLTDGKRNRFVQWVAWIITVFGIR